MPPKGQQAEHKPARAKTPTIHGLLLVDKPEGITSNGVLGRLKRILNQKKMGHAGTLDPLATGLLPVALGEATKVLRYITDDRKTYQFTVRWGMQTDTDDAEGDVVEESDSRPDDAGIKGVLEKFTGEITQVPPAYSAIKINGKRAYDLARAGEVVEMKPRQVQVYRLELLECMDADHARFEIECGKGTYVRALARDIALVLGTVGHITAIRRTRIGKFSVDDAFSLEKEGENGHSPSLENYVLPVLRALDDIPALEVDDGITHMLVHGQSVSLNETALLAQGIGDFLTAHKAYIKSRQPIAITQGETLIALCEIQYPFIKPVRVFNL